MQHQTVVKFKVDYSLHFKHLKVLEDSNTLKLTTTYTEATSEEENKRLTQKIGRLISTKLQQSIKELGANVVSGYITENNLPQNRKTLRSLQFKVTNINQLGDNLIDLDWLVSNTQRAITL